MVVSRMLFTLKNFIFSSHSRSIDVYSVRAPEPVKVSKSYFGFSDAFRYKFTDDLMLKALLIQRCEYLQVRS